MGKVKGTKTEANLLPSFAGESQARNRYTFFAATARKEGRQQIAAIFDETAQQESAHAKRLFKFLEGGDLHEGPDAPEICPACAHPQAHFELLGENW